MATYPSRTPGELGGLSDRIDRLEAQLRRVLSPTAEQYAQAVETLAKTVDDTAKTATLAQKTATQAQATATALPIVKTTTGGTYGLGMTGQASNAWFEWVTLEVVVPDGKTSLDGIVMATASIADASSGGVAFVNMRIRVGYPSGNQYSMTFPSAKQFGSYDSRNAITGAFRVSQTQMKAGQKVTIGIQLAASSPSAFPAAKGNDLEASAIISAANLP